MRLHSIIAVLLVHGVAACAGSTDHYGIHPGSPAAGGPVRGYKGWELAGAAASGEIRQRETIPAPADRYTRRDVSLRYTVAGVMPQFATRFGTAPGVRFDAVAGLATRRLEGSQETDYAGAAHMRLGLPFVLAPGVRHGLAIELATELGYQGHSSIGDLFAVGLGAVRGAVRVGGTLVARCEYEFVPVAAGSSSFDRLVEHRASLRLDRGKWGVAAQVRVGQADSALEDDDYQAISLTLVRWGARP
ncbi:MAG TPA: hypothetical protein VML75_22510 [Kofleriaceae bacterium]|nr:hypothetical protein [Kofleriaceae bacterium]